MNYIVTSNKTDQENVMNRSWRTAFDGALYHGLSGENEQQHIYKDDQGGELFFELIDAMSARFEIDVKFLANTAPVMASDSGSR